ncbi:MAG: tetratricopeptide repeat protein [Acidobacteria bacterium]|nr:tetratricopeptide repeat protein [Acidobacteriota bacterium]
MISNLGLALAVQFWLDNQVRSERAGDDPLYFTSGKVVKRASLGFDGLVSDIYWMRTILYFGEQIENQARQKNKTVDLRQMRQLEPLLEITTDLDPYNIKAYRFGAFFLPEIDLEKAAQLAEKAVQNNPGQWQLLQDLGFVYWRQGRFQEAEEAYLKGSKIKGAPQWMLIMAMTMMAKGGDDKTSRDIFRRLCEATEDKFIMLICAENQTLYAEKESPVKEPVLPKQVGMGIRQKQEVGSLETEERSQKQEDSSQREIGLRQKEVGIRQKAIGAKVAGSR